MLISCNWLMRHVTLGVAELEDIIRVGAGLATGVVVGRVTERVSVEGTKLSACKVDVGDGSPRSIICGAPNVAVGQHVPVVLPGTTIGDLTIAEREVRGVLSQGMIASESELGLSDDHDGIMVLEGAPAPGTPLGELFDVEDVLFEIDNKSLTHRPDLWGHRGIAREIAALLGRELKPLPLDVPFTAERPLALDVQAADACPRYLAVCLDGVTIRRSPLWLRTLLHRVGTRAINNVVDATNFVMLDVGNPLHAFDRRELQGDRIVVRHAREGEVFTTLDGVARALTPADLLIGDGERGVALAGIMGGENSEIRDDTSRVVLESANFVASGVRLTGTRLGLRTESSARFEKSLDPHLCEDAARAFCRLLQQLDPAVRVTSALMESALPLPAPPVIELRVDRVRRRLGVDLDVEAITRTLRRLEFGVVASDDGHTLAVTVPTFRASKDVGIEADLIEELGRSYGYDHIVPQPAAVTLTRPHPNKQKLFERAARAYLTQAGGLDEVLTYSFGFEPRLAKIGADFAARTRLANPLSVEMTAMRTHLGPNLLGVLEGNERRVDHLRVFELGRVFLPVAPTDEEPRPLPSQPVTLGALIADKSITDDPDAVLFVALKGIVGGLARAVERPVPRLVQGGVDLPWAHPVRQARLRVGDTDIGYLAEVHPLTLHALELDHRAALFEVDLDAWRALPAQGPRYRPLDRFPAVFRDFAVIVAEAARADDVASAIHAASEDRVADVAFQSVYRGPGVAEGHKSMAWHVTLQRPDATLTDPEVRELEHAIWESLALKVGGRPRVDV